MNNNLSTDKHRQRGKEKKENKWNSIKERRQHQNSYMSFVWNLNQKAVRDKKSFPLCDFSKWHDGNPTDKLHLSLGPLNWKMQLKTTLEFWEPVTKKNIFAKSNYSLNFIMGWNSRINFVLFSWSLLLSSAGGSNHWFFVLQYKTTWWETVWENRRDEKREKNVAVVYMLQRGCRDDFCFLVQHKKKTILKYRYALT